MLRPINRDFDFDATTEVVLESHLSPDSREYLLEQASRLYLLTSEVERIVAEFDPEVNTLADLIDDVLIDAAVFGEAHDLEPDWDDAAGFFY